MRWQRAKEQKQRLEMAMQQRYTEIEQRLVARSTTPGWRKVVVCVPGTAPKTIDEYEGPRDDGQEQPA